MSDAKRWVTVRVPEADREQAAEYKPDDVTWGECLVAGAQQWRDSLDSDGPDAEVTVRPTVDEDALNELTEQVEAALPEFDPEKVAEMVAEVRANGEFVEPEWADSDDLAREVAAKIDYAELATRTADELEGRLRR